MPHLLSEESYAPIGNLETANSATIAETAMGLQIDTDQGVDQIVDTLEGAAPEMANEADPEMEEAPEEGVTAETVKGENANLKAKVAKAKERAKALKEAEEGEVQEAIAEGTKITEAEAEEEKDTMLRPPLVQKMNKSLRTMTNKVEKEGTKKMMITKTKVIIMKNMKKKARRRIQKMRSHHPLKQRRMRTLERDGPQP